MKPGDLLEWDDDALRDRGYTLDEGDAVSPFLVVTVEEKLHEVKLLDSLGRLTNYDVRALKSLTRKLG